MPTDDVFYDPMDPPEVYRDANSMFINNFKDGVTLMRLVAPLGDKRYVGVRYHWDSDNRRSYPCLANSAPNGQCIGCVSANPETRKQKQRVIVPALDKSAYLRLFSFPQGLFNDLLALAEESVGDDEDVTDYMTKVVQSREGSGPVKYRIFLKLTNDELPEFELGPDQVRESLRNEYVRALEAIHPELAGVAADDGWSDDEEVAPMEKEAVRKVVRRQRKAAPKPAATTKSKQKVIEAEEIADSDSEEVPF